MIVAGFGYRAQARVADLRAALGADRPDALASITAKATGPLAHLARDLGLPLIALDPGALHGVETPTTSARMVATFGTGSLAEAAALVAVGPGARLIAPRRVGPGGLATVAFAEGTRK